MSDGKEMTGRGARSRPRAAQQRSALDDMAQNADAAANLLKSLAHGHRLRILCLLAGGKELSVGQLNERIALSQSALSQHLSRLRAKGLVATRREAQTIYYRLGAAPVEEIIGALHGIYCRAPRPRPKR